MFTSCCASYSVVGGRNLEFLKTGCLKFAQRCMPPSLRQAIETCLPSRLIQGHQSEKGRGSKISEDSLKSKLGNPGARNPE